MRVSALRCQANVVSGLRNDDISLQSHSIFRTEANMYPVSLGIIVSLSIIAALSIAVLENPQVQEWLEQQRVKIAELLRSLGEDLDPEARRQAEAFAYGGRAPATDVGLRRESEGSKEAAAVATGRSLSGISGTIRRIPVQGPADPDEAAERRRKGREYLAKRNQQIFELQERRKATKGKECAKTSSTPTSFDAIVDEDGKLKTPTKVESELRLIDAAPQQIREEMREVEQQLVQPMLVAESSSSNGIHGFEMGTKLTNPFGDEYAMDAMDMERSETPKPPVPPKLELDFDGRRNGMVFNSNNDDRRGGLVMPGSFDQVPPSVEEHSIPNPEELTYEEQLAIALSLSEAESANAATVRQRSLTEESDNLQAAIAASLKDMDDQQAAHAVAHAEPTTPRPISAEPEPLVDLTPPSPTIQPQNSVVRSEWQHLFDPSFSPSNEPLTLAPHPSSEVSEDELYRITPQLTRARLASLHAQQASSSPTTSYDPVREAANSQAHWAEPIQSAPEASFYSASASPPPGSRTIGPEETPEPAAAASRAPDREGAQTPTTVAPSSFGFETDSESETFASVMGSRAASRAHSALSDVEIVDVAEDTDVDMLSEEGDGIATPDSWTEVGSRDGEESEDERRAPLHVHHVNIQ